MKSQVNAVWIAGAGILAVIGVLSFSLAYQVQSVVRGLHEKNIIETINEVEFTKKALHQSLIYSTYQSAYEILKFGGYTTEGCEPATYDNLPYWRTYDNTCAPANVKIPLENRIKEIFSEYLVALQNKVEKIHIKIPNYEINLILNDRTLDVIATASDRVKFVSENLEIYDSADIVKTVNIAVNGILKIGRENFVDNDPIKNIIQDSNTEMVSTNYDSTLKNCKKIIKESCGLSSVQTKQQILDSNCPKALDKFENKIKSKLSEFSSEDPDYDMQLIPKNIETSVDKIDESTCSLESKPNFEECPCISWVCSGDYQVKTGDTRELTALGEKTPANPDDSCTQCFSLTTVPETDAMLCQQYSVKTCPTGNSPANGNCIEKSDPQCPFTGEERNPPCNKAFYSNGHNHCHETEAASSAECPVNPIYIEESSDGNSVTYKADAVCPSGYTLNPDSDKCTKIVDKTCPSGTQEFGNTGRCYKITSISSTCNRKDDLYTKTCIYNYQASANALVNIKDSEAYPVYDASYGKTDMKNLELQFYVLSKN